MKYIQGPKSLFPLPPRSKSHLRCGAGIGYYLGLFMFMLHLVPRTNEVKLINSGCQISFSSSLSLPSSIFLVHRERLSSVKARFLSLVLRPVALRSWEMDLFFMQNLRPQTRSPGSEFVFLK